MASPPKAELFLLGPEPDAQAIVIYGATEESGLLHGRHLESGRLLVLDPALRDMLIPIARS